MTEAYQINIDHGNTFVIYWRYWKAWEANCFNEMLILVYKRGNHCWH